MNRLRRAAQVLRNRWLKLVSRIKPYEPMGQGQTLLDAQYAEAEWDYLRSIEEAPRFGVVSSYCRRLGEGGSILEIGCGDALLLEHLDRGRYAHFTGLDISAVAIERTRPLWNDRTVFVCGDAETFSPDRQFDLIVFNEVLEYFDDPFALVRRYEAFAKPDAHFVVSMFAGIDTDRTWHIWRRLASRYRRVAHAEISTQPDYLWRVKAFRAHPGG